MQRVCTECGKNLPEPKGDPMGVPDGVVRVRLVRHPTGKLEDWGTSEKTLAPNVLVCDLCLRLPRSDPVRVGNPERLEDTLTTMPPGAVYGWPYWASCYLVPEATMKKETPKTWAALQQKEENVRELGKRFNLLDRLLALWAWARRQH